jgi:HEAT repeat protein
LVFLGMSVLRIHVVLSVLVCLAVAGAMAQEKKVDTAAVDGDFRKEASTDSVILMLVDQLGKKEAEARDASAKLAQIGKKAVPILADLLERGPSDQVKYYSALALSRIRHASAAQAMLPLLTAKDASREMRLLAIESAAGSSLDESTKPLAELVDSGEDAEVRMKALQALSVMPVAWRDCEELFAKTLLDPSEEIRLLGTQVCFYAAAVKIVYGAAEPTLLELTEKDPSLTVRCRCLRALARMKSGRAVALSVRLLDEVGTPRELSRQALATVQTITEVPVQDAGAVQRWWEKHGKERYANAPALRPFTIPRDKEKDADARAKANPVKNDPKKADLTTKRTEGPSEPAVDTQTAPPETKASATSPPPASARPVEPDSTGRRKILDEGDDSRPLSGVPIR